MGPGGSGHKVEIRLYSAYPRHHRACPAHPGNHALVAGSQPLPLSAPQRQADARDDCIPGTLFPRGVIDQHAVNEAAGKVATVIPDLVAPVA